MFLQNSVFFNFLIFIDIIFVISNSDEPTSNLKFNLQFKCGDEPASGRLMFYYTKALTDLITGVSAFILNIHWILKNSKLWRVLT